MSSTGDQILQALREIRLIDPHSHINPHQPASSTLADLLGYHYYTELVHSAGMPKREIEAAGVSPRALVGRLVKGLPHLTNTVQHTWLIDICQRFFGFEGDVIDESNWESLYDAAEAKMQVADWADSVLEQSNVEAVFLTNDFDDKLVGFDTKTYIPCLRTDDLVFHLSNSGVRDRLAVCTGIDLEGSLKSLRDALEQRFEHFVSHGARACAISLPPDFTPAAVSDGRAATALDAILRLGVSADGSHKTALAKRMFWTIVELCDQYRLPMDLMIGVNRGVYDEGVFQGRDLYDSRVSLIQYRELFNAFPAVKFPISVLASVTNQELVSYAWIFPNVVTNGHWWYSNTPSFIRRDAAARLEAVPRNKQIGYYSDAYKLEFIAPKFDMYRRILASILTDDFVIGRGWSEEQAIELGRQILRGNVDTLFPDRTPSPKSDRDSQDHWSEPIASSTVTPLVAASTFVASETLPIDELSVDGNEQEPDETGSGASVSDSTLIDWTPETASVVEQQTNKPIDLHATLDMTPEYPEDLQSDAPSPTDQIQYFRGDDDVPPVDTSDPLDETDDGLSLVPDPVTGELTWPEESIEETSDSELDETYLLTDEPASPDSDPAITNDDVEIVDFDEIVMEPVDEDSGLMPTIDDADDELSLFDPEQTLDYESDEQKNE